jgi:multicomponent Na+:H+ antiporter subunit D
MSAFVILLLGLIGLPLTSGFISKWYLISAILQSDYWYISGVILITSFMTLFYVWLLIEKIYFSVRLNHEASIATSYQLLCVYFLAAITIYLGVDTSLTFGISEQISNNFYSIISQ